MWDLTSLPVERRKVQEYWKHNMTKSRNCPGKIPWRREWLPTAVFLPGEFHEQRNLAGYSPWSRRVRHDQMTNTFFFTFTTNIEVKILTSISV